MKLYEIPRHSKIKLNLDGEEEMCLFHSIDGMYSYIARTNGEAVHLGASTEVKKVDDHYELN